jgi:hypothetical protein
VERYIFNNADPQERLDKLQELLWSNELVLLTKPWSQHTHARRPAAFKKQVLEIVLQHTREPNSLLYHMPYELVELLIDALASVK